MYPVIRESPLGFPHFTTTVDAETVTMVITGGATRVV